MSHQHQKQPKSHPDVACKLCFLPEGDSAFVRVGKYKVRHEDCLGAWPKEDREKGRDHVFALQVERLERELLQAEAAKAGVSGPAGDAVPLPSEPAPAAQ